MNIPKRLKVGGHQIKVEYAELEDCTGEWDVRRNTLRIANDIPKSHQEAAFIHEIVCHVINSTFSSEHIGHALLDSISEQIYQVFSDNDLLK